MCGVDIGQTPRDFLFFGEPLSANRSSAGSCRQQHSESILRSRGLQGQAAAGVQEGMAAHSKMPDLGGPVRGGHCCSSLS